MNDCNCPAESAPTQERRDDFQRPQFRTREDENGATLQIALPGVRKEDLKLTLHESALRIGAERADAVPAEWKTHRGSAPPAAYQLDIRLTRRLDGTNTRAVFENGVLTLTVPLREEAKPRQIHVN